MPDHVSRSHATSAAMTRPIGAVIFVAAALALSTLAVAVVESGLGGGVDGAPLYLVAVVVVATRYRTAAGIATALASFAIYNLLFTEPRFTPFVADPTEWLNLMLFLFVAVAIGRLAGVGADRAAEAEARARESAALYEISRTLATGGIEVAVPLVVQRLVTDTAMDRVWCTVETDGLERVLADSGQGDVGPSPPVVRSLTPGAGEPTWMRTHVGRSQHERRPGTTARYRIRLDADGHAVGALWATREDGRPDPSREETRLLALAADQLGLAIQREQLRERAVAAEVARRDDALKTALVDSVSHDLRTPLAGIRAAAGTLADPAQVRRPEEVRATAALIEAETKRLDRLVSGLLDLSRIQAGSIRPHLEALDVEGMVRPVVDRLSPILGGRHVELDIPPDLPPLAGDAGFVDQCLANLIENVARHTPATASLIIMARVLPGPDPATTSQVELVVEDDGPGVDPETTRRLFDRFYRSGSAGPSVGGMGVGLTIVRGLTEAMGGSVEATRGSRGGLAVHLRLPAMPLPIEERVGEEHPGPTDGRTGRGPDGGADGGPRPVDAVVDGGPDDEPRPVDAVADGAATP